MVSQRTDQIDVGYRAGHRLRDDCHATVHPASFLCRTGHTMGLLNSIKKNPVWVLCFAVLLLIGWVAVDLAKTDTKKPSAGLSSPSNELPVPGRTVEAAILGDDVPVVLPPGNSVVSSTVLPQLKPGMKRVEVERVLGPPTPDQIHPVTLNNGRMTYSTAYEFDDLGPPMTIRPITSRLLTLPPPPARPARSHIAFVFDATATGHPLIAIQFSDPLF